MKNNNIELSVIIPLYNAEEHLSTCIDSLMHQGDLHLEIIIVNDGSTDRSEAIAVDYAQQDKRIKVIHQENRGTSAARNTGLQLAQGEFIAFLDNDDWIKDDSLIELYREATKHHADVVMGKIWFYKHNSIIKNPYKPVPEDMRNSILPGKELFIRMIKADAYPSMPWNYIYRRTFLEKIHARFEEGVICEDEIWTPIILCQAEKMIIVDVGFYYYRQWAGSIIYSKKRNQYLDALFKITNCLMEFACRFTFSGEDGELKNWWYVNIFRMYATAFMLLAGIKDSSYTVPFHYLDRFWRDCCDMTPEARKICGNYYKKAEEGLKKYTDWRISDWVTSVGYQLANGKKLMLIYNVLRNDDLSLNIEEVPDDWVLTTDRHFFQQAQVVVFHLPTLYQELEDDLIKPQGQIWIAWYPESEKIDKWVEDPEIRELFNQWISYPKETEKELLWERLCWEINKEILN
jgi:glycosyltransferase involved in cell wall biosynthesis